MEQMDLPKKTNADGVAGVPSAKSDGEGQAAWERSVTPDVSPMLVGGWVPDDPRDIDFSRLPRIPLQHAVVSDVRGQEGHRVNQHNYLVFHDGAYWAMWSDGPGISQGVGKVPEHDQADQHISFATSPDGITWSKSGDMAGVPEPGFGWIARGFWVRDGKLLGLASRYHAPHYWGDGLQLHAFEVNATANGPVWKHYGLLRDNTLNNFEPKKLPTGEWMMSRRDGNGDVHFMIGGTEAFDQWESFPMIGYADTLLAAEEPHWWVLPDGRLAALFRDNRRSGRLFRSFSVDNGRTWSKPLRTNFPDATSKFCGLRLRDGRYVLVSNPNPKKRDPLALSISDDGLVFTKMGYLVGGQNVDYPHVIEHDGYLFVAYASIKQSVEVLKIKITDLDQLPMPPVMS